MYASLNGNEHRGRISNQTLDLAFISFSSQLRRSILFSASLWASVLSGPCFLQLIWYKNGHISLVKCKTVLSNKFSQDHITLQSSPVQVNKLLPIWMRKGDFVFLLIYLLFSFVCSYWSFYIVDNITSRNQIWLFMYSFTKRNLMLAEVWMLCLMYESWWCSIKNMSISIITEGQTACWIKPAVIMNNAVGPYTKAFLVLLPWPWDSSNSNWNK